MLEQTRFLSYQPWQEQTSNRESRVVSILLPLQAVLIIPSASTIISRPVKSSFRKIIRQVIRTTLNSFRWTELTRDSQAFKILPMNLKSEQCANRQPVFWKVSS